MRSSEILGYAIIIAVVVFAAAGWAKAAYELGKADGKRETAALCTSGGGFYYSRIEYRCAPTFHTTIGEWTK